MRFAAKATRISVVGISTIGRYELNRELGRGGMAIVYLARDPLFGRQVALKVLPSQFKLDKQYLVRFQREAKVIAALEHPYIVPVYDYGEEGDQPYIVMRYMSGGTLTERMRAGPMPPAQAATIVQRLAEALDEAHSQGIVHRDLKPTNVLFDSRGQPYLSDFGIAKILEDAVTSSLTGSGVVGTPTYMSPEQAMGDRHIDHRSDIYALGVMVYEMLVGRHPYEATTPMRVLLKHISDPVPQVDLAELQRLGLTTGFNAILSKALAKKPEERYATAAQLAGPLATLAASPAAPLEASSEPIQVVQPVVTRSLAEGGGAAATLVSSMRTSTTSPPVASASPTIPWRWLLGGAFGMALIVGVLGLGMWLGSVVNQTPTPTLTSTQAMAATSPLTIATAVPTQPANLPMFTETPRPTASETPTLMPTETLSATPTVTVTRRPTRLPPTNTLAPTLPPTQTAAPPGDGGPIEPPPTITLAPP